MSLLKYTFFLFVFTWLVYLREDRACVMYAYCVLFRRIRVEKPPAGIKYSSIPPLSRNTFYRNPLCYLRKQRLCYCINRLYVNAVRQVLQCDVIVLGKPVFHASTSQWCERDKPRSIMSLGYFKYQLLQRFFYLSTGIGVFWTFIQVKSHLLCEKDETWRCVLFPWYTLDRIHSPSQ